MDIVSTAVIVPLVTKIIHDMRQADKNNSEAEKISIRSLNRQFQAQRIDEESRREFRKKMKKVADRKRAILNTSFPQFELIFSKIAEIKFDNNTKGIQELFSNECITQFAQGVEGVFTLEPLEMTDVQLVTTYLIPQAVSGLILTATGSIGIVEGMIVGCANSSKKKSEIELTNANAIRKQVRVYETAVKAQKDAIDAVCWHLEELSTILARMNVLFYKSMKESKKIIDKNGYEGSRYSDKELAYIGTCMNLAKALKDIINVPILDKENQLIEAATEVIISSRVCLEEFEEAF